MRMDTYCNLMLKYVSFGSPFWTNLTLGGCPVSGVLKESLILTLVCFIRFCRMYELMYTHYELKIGFSSKLSLFVSFLRMYGDYISYKQ